MTATDIKPLLYLLTEDDNDDLFFERCAERISGLSFQQMDPRRLRKNGGIGAARKAMPHFLNDLKKAAFQPAFFVIAIDNDRAPAHPDHKSLPNLGRRDHGKQCRHCEIMGMIQKEWGHDFRQWPVQGAIAVPVQMLESWLLLGLDPERGTLPMFSTKTSSLAKAYHNGKPPDQLKDLRDNYRASNNNIAIGDLCVSVVESLDLGEVCKASPSFRLFHDQVLLWSTPANAE
ncbi:hypothetical protein [Fuerstiella marisgermanici]|uniref:DUF4276 family protein n=1 Tax=Fuerstiella marisgermanici TaxID=1891926 RepID=A0A1P8WN85_9PLAN|nr:hypothetical protein [Fuerstiella marisgermanici]APZ95508.1 hypothetical protein Fuma_05166 [Fuerstiella marisgermanici]